MERTEIFEMMGALKLYGMRAAPSLVRALRVAHGSLLFATWTSPQRRSEKGPSCTAIDNLWCVNGFAPDNALMEKHIFSGTAEVGPGALHLVRTALMA